MQKKIIALAVAGLVSGAAFAESNVVISGIVDVGYQYSSDGPRTVVIAKMRSTTAVKIRRVSSRWHGRSVMA